MTLVSWKSRGGSRNDDTAALNRRALARQAPRLCSRDRKSASLAHRLRSGGAMRRMWVGGVLVAWLASCNSDVGCDLDTTQCDHDYECPDNSVCQRGSPWSLGGSSCVPAWLCESDSDCQRWEGASCTQRDGAEAEHPFESGAFHGKRVCECSYGPCDPSDPSTNASSSQASSSSGSGGATGQGGGGAGVVREAERGDGPPAGAGRGGAGERGGADP